MKLVVYKGFDEEFLSMVKEEPLVDGTIATKLNVLEFDKKTRKQLDMALISLEESDEVWVTYSEYTSSETINAVTILTFSSAVSPFIGTDGTSVTDFLSMEINALPLVCAFSAILSNRATVSSCSSSKKSGLR